MSEKMTCPGCGGHGSDVLRAFREGAPCPWCGLSAEAAAEVINIRASRADEALKAQLTEAVKGKDAAERQARSAEYKLRELRRVIAEVLNAPDPDWLHDGQHG